MKLSNLDLGQATDLADGPEVVGEIGKEIVTLPDLHPDRINVVTSARAVITEVGGALAHLACVARERAIPMMLVKDARRRFPEGTRLRVTAVEGKIRHLGHELIDEDD